MLKGIAKKKFEELTGGLSLKEAAVNVFGFIRDIPYYIDPEHFKLDKGPDEMLALGRGSCFPKHYLLGEMFRELGLEVEYFLYPFHWKDQGLAMPDELKRRAVKIPATCHMSCKVLEDGKWITVDATWNKALLGSGFKVNDSWDGRKSLRLAVIPADEIRAASRAKAAGMVQKMFVSYTLGERLELSRFTIEFNRWMGKISI